jgi:two-component system, LytTR family, response regulator
VIINCIIVEDEPLALKRTIDYVAKVSFLNLLASFSNAFDAINFLKKTPVDLVFLDIEMDGFTGIEFIESIAVRPRVILTTAYDKYALKGFELHVDDYLLKPFSIDRFINAVERVYESLAKAKKAEKDFIFIKTEYRLQRVALSDIFFIEGRGDYRTIQTAAKKILTLQTFSELEKELPTYNFCRVHKSYIVCTDKIVSIERNRIKIMDKLIPISDNYRKRFYELIGVKNEK